MARSGISETDVDFTDAYLDETIATFTAFRTEPQHRPAMAGMAEVIVTALRAGRKLLVCGNGGSAGDAQHIAAEFVSRLMYDRAPLAAIALTTDTSILTAVANDYGFEHIYERQVLALGQDGDVLLGISTGGSSPNILRAFAAARGKGMACLGFTGNKGGPMREACQFLVEAPSASTVFIQQIHITAAHIVCAMVETAMFPRS